MNISDAIVTALINCDINQSLNYFNVEHNDKLTNEVREKLDELSESEIKKIKVFLSSLLNLCYDGKIYRNENNIKSQLIDSLDDKNIHLIKETIIYFLGRLSIKPDIEVLKKIYNIEDNIYIKFNIACTNLATFDEEIELDFISKLVPGSEYDKTVRSWTMAFYNNLKNPYEYVDNKNNDWTNAKNPRIKRLAINDKNHKKYLKAMSFRGFDLAIIYIFLENRGDKLSIEEQQIIKDADISFSEYSDNKKEILNDLKIKILKR